VNKLLIPSILAVTIIVAGIFAFVPIDEASTVHTTLASSADVTTITNAQFNNVNSTFDSDLSTNATATCSTGSFLVFYSYSNRTSNSHTNATLGIDVNQVPSGMDFFVRASLGNETVSGVVAGSANQQINFSGMETDTTINSDSGSLSLTIQCQSTATPSLIP